MFEINLQSLHVLGLSFKVFFVEEDEDVVNHNFVLFE